MTGLGIGHPAQPIPRSPSRPDANDNKTGQATEYLATGKGHERNHLLNLRRTGRSAKGEYDTPAIEKY
jgi:hypothetical protein